MQTFDYKGSQIRFAYINEELWVSSRDIGNALNPPYGGNSFNRFIRKSQFPQNGKIRFRLNPLASHDSVLLNETGVKYSCHWIQGKDSELYNWLIDMLGKKEICLVVNEQEETLVKSFLSFMRGEQSYEYNEYLEKVGKTSKSEGEAKEAEKTEDEEREEVLGVDGYGENIPEFVEEPDYADIPPEGNAFLELQGKVNALEMRVVLLEKAYEGKGRTEVSVPEDWRKRVSDLVN